MRKPNPHALPLPVAQPRNKAVVLRLPACPCAALATPESRLPLPPEEASQNSLNRGGTPVSIRHRVCASCSLPATTEPSAYRRRRVPHLRPAATTARSQAHGPSPAGRASIAAGPSSAPPPPPGSICRKCPIARRTAPASARALPATPASVRAIDVSCRPPSKKTVAGRFPPLHPSIGSAVSRQNTASSIRKPSIPRLFNRSSTL